MLLAFAQGEVEAAGLTWNALSTGRTDWVKPGGLARLIVEFATKPTPGIDVLYGPKQKPVAGKEGIYALINTALGLPQGSVGAPPGTPAERVEELREAYRKMLKDPMFNADAVRLAVPIDGLIGEDLKRQFVAFFKVSPEEQAQFKDLLQ